MTGKTHKAIGVATGVAFTLYGVGSGDAMYALAMLTAPFGAMLPDIDHDRSKLGSQRKEIFDNIEKLITIGIIGTIVTTIVYGLATHNPLFILKLAPLVLIIGGCSIIGNSPKFKKRYKFLTKHRGIMHTLAVPLAVYLCTFIFDTPFIDPMLYGLSLGYLSHLIADCCTIMGCPILWPFTEKCISLTTIKTGTIWEYIMGGVLIVCIVGMGVFLGL